MRVVQLLDNNDIIIQRLGEDRWESLHEMSMSAPVAQVIFEMAEWIKVLDLADPK